MRDGPLCAGGSARSQVSNVISPASLQATIFPAASAVRACVPRKRTPSGTQSACSSFWIARSSGAAVLSAMTLPEPSRNL
jgi:hypothetical protein